MPRLGAISTGRTIGGLSENGPKIWAGRKCGSMLKEGLYQVEITTNRGLDRGLVTVTQGKIFGGDPVFTYTGHISEKDGIAHLVIRTARYHTDRAHRSVLGHEAITLRLQGSTNAYEAEFCGFAKELAGENISARLSLICE